MLIVVAYLVGAYRGRWEFGPYWLAACVILDVYWYTTYNRFGFFSTHPTDSRVGYGLFLLKE